MHARCSRLLWLMGSAVILLSHAVAVARTFRIATFNLEGYLDKPTETRPAKAAESKAGIRESIKAASPDVVALQEIGSTNALLELRDSLRSDGLDFPYWEHVAGADTNIHVAVLSRFPFTRTQPHTNEQFLLSGRRFRCSRGFAEVDIRVTPAYSFTLLSAHLKSKRAVGSADESEMRLEEAKLLREKIDARLAANPNANVVVLGDLNDTKDSASTKAVLGRGRHKLIDTRPAERNGDPPCRPGPRGEIRNVCWTHYYAKDDTYSRIDFLLLSAGMAREWITNETFIPYLSGWGLGSDHRPIVATFQAEDK